MRFLTAPLHACLTLALGLTLGCASSAKTSPKAESPPSAETPTAPEGPAEEYLVGTVVTTSPDGATPYGPPVRTVAHRMWKHGSIVEAVFYDGKLRTTSMVVNRNARDIVVVSDDKSFTGSIAFEGDAFLWAKWTYAITMQDGVGTIAGTGVREGTGFTTTKVFSANAVAQAKIVEQFRVVDKAIFDEELKHLRKDAAKGEAATVAP